MADPSETTHVSREAQTVESTELLEAVRALSAQVEGLQTDVQVLRAQNLALPSQDGERPGWDEGAPVVHETAAWVRSIHSPSKRRLSVPWLLVEIVFLVAVATLAAIADLDPPVVAAVMIVAWALVALAEWLTSRSALREPSLLSSSPTLPTAQVNDPMWFEPPTEQSALELPAPGERAATRLPPPEPE